MVRKGNEVGVAGVASAGAGLRQSSELSLPDETNGLGLASGGSAIDAGAGGQSSESSLASMAPSPTPRAKAAAPVGAKARGVGGPSSSELALGDGCAGDAWVGVSGFAGRAAVLRVRALLAWSGSPALEPAAVHPPSAASGRRE